MLGDGPMRPVRAVELVPSAGAHGCSPLPESPNTPGCPRVLEPRYLTLTLLRVPAGRDMLCVARGEQHTTRADGCRSTRKMPVLKLLGVTPRLGRWTHKSPTMKVGGNRTVCLVGVVVQARPARSYAAFMRFLLLVPIHHFLMPTNFWPVYSNSVLCLLPGAVCSALSSRVLSRATSRVVRPGHLARAPLCSAISRSPKSSTAGTRFSCLHGRQLHGRSRTVRPVLVSSHISLETSCDPFCW